jgi:lipopolysaccharide biosynthesis glycosyltransferase
MKKINIVACLDKDYVMPVGVMMYSVCYNNQNIEIVFHIIADESVKEKDKVDLTNTASRFGGKYVMFYSIDRNKVSKFPDLIDGPSFATYYRLFLTEILPDSIDKVIYLDGDVVVRKSLLSLWQSDIENYAVAAVPDISPEDIYSCERLKYDSRLGYFNAGVLLINLRYWREHNVIERFCEYIMTNYNSIHLQDQDVLNYVFREEKYMLPYKYNYQQNLVTKKYYYYNINAVLEACKDPIVLHFSGYNKPWNSYKATYNPYNSSFYKYQNQTIWKGLTIDRRSLKLKVKNHVAKVLRKMRIKSTIRYVDIQPVDKI